MYTRFIILVFCTVTMGLPLNINLGAFSPAFVVGDGEISFGAEGGKEAEGLVNTLAGASAGTANKGAQEALNGEASATGTKNSEVKVAKEERSIADNKTRSEKINSRVKISPRMSSRRSLELRDLETRDLDGFNAALKFADGALLKGPNIDLGTGEGGSGVGITIRPGEKKAE